MENPLTIIDDGDTQVQLYPEWLPNADAVFLTLREEMPWQGRTVKLFGRHHVIPRLECWLSEPEVQYTYSAQTYRGDGWPTLFLDWVEQLHGQFLWRPNGALLNYYRDGRDAMGWHSDNEPELGSEPSIAILSLGATRDIRLRQIGSPSNTVTIGLPSGSLLWMSGRCQQQWQHAIPKRSKGEARISCTFRKITGY